VGCELAGGAHVAGTSGAHPSGGPGLGHRARAQLSHAGIDDAFRLAGAVGTDTPGSAVASKPGTSANDAARKDASFGSVGPTSAAALALEQEQAVALSRLQQLVAVPERVNLDLRMCFVAADVAQRGRLARETALQVLMAALTAQLSDLPATSIDKAKWLSLLKSFGLYSAEDSIAFDGLLQLYSYTLGTLRDCFAPREVLRSMRQVPRSSSRLKDRYDNFEFQAKDSLGQLHRCRCRATKEQRSCRQIRKDKASVPVDRIRQCLQQMQELSHPHVPAVIEHLEDFHNFYVISAPFDGTDLMDFIQGSYVQSKGLTEAWVSDVLRQVLEAVAYCHSQPLGPVMHRDLRPASVLVSAVDDAAGECSGSRRQRSQPHVVVPGFGLQVLFDLPRLDGSLQLGCQPVALQDSAVSLESVPCCSQPEFLAPEVWRRDFGPRCDVWSCGCLMFLLLTASSPFDPKLPLRELVHAAVEPDWRLFRHASTSALSLCRRMLATGDAARPSAAECLRHPWFAGPSALEHVPRGLRPETLGTLMQFHAHSKFLQVLMNTIAMELQVGRLRCVRTIFAEADSQGSGYVAQADFRAGMVELGVSFQSVDQVLQVLGAGGPGEVAYGPFLTGCVELVDDKLDHMLWKVFTMVDEEHSGEMSAVVLEHFLEALSSDASGNRGSGGGGGGHGDVEQYLRGVLDAKLIGSEVVQQVAGGRDIVTFEEVKRFMLEGTRGGFRAGGRAGEASECP